MLVRQAMVGVAPRARCPIDLAALPPDCAQTALVSAGGSTTAVPASAGSTCTLASVDSTEMRWPTVGVTGFLPLLSTPQPPTRPAIASTRKTRFIIYLPAVRRGRPEAHRRLANPPFA